MSELGSLAKAEMMCNNQAPRAVSQMCVQGSSPQLTVEQHAKQQLIASGPITDSTAKGHYLYVKKV